MNDGASTARTRISVACAFFRLCSGHGDSLAHRRQHGRCRCGAATSRRSLSERGLARHLSRHIGWRRLSLAHEWKDAEGEDAALALFGLEKAAYEVAYEAENRPTWLRAVARSGRVIEWAATLFRRSRTDLVERIMSVSNKEPQGQAKESLLPAPHDIDALVRCRTPRPVFHPGASWRATPAANSFARICPVR